MPSYHFDIGDSDDGPLGLCARVTADTREEALELLEEALPQTISVPTSVAGVEYINVYTNTGRMRVDDIDESDEEDEEPEED